MSTRPLKHNRYTRIADKKAFDAGWDAAFGTKRSPKKVLARRRGKAYTSRTPRS